MRRLILLLTVIPLLAACNPYMAAIGVATQTYDAATDPRSLATQASDTEIEAKISGSLLESPVPGTSGLSVFCRQGVVVLAGMVPLGSPAGPAAVEIARTTSGVRRVETFFVHAQPSKTADFDLASQIKTAFVGDPNIVADDVDVRVYAGNAVLVGVVTSIQQKERFVDDAFSVAGVVSVHSYIQVRS
ncbi:MAG TPA: BON domain-containing protein [Candidatus Dormibacteraeota bacterium]|nr:BON domain-containing protein [Candidatus Dormibacteraeota bacterium]